MGRASERSESGLPGLAAEAASGAPALAAEIAQSELLLRLIEENADAILALDTGGVVRYANYAAERLLDRSASALVGTTFGLPAAADGPVEVELVRPDGQVVLAEMRVVPSVWHGQVAHVVTLRDITQRRRHEGQLRQDQKMEALGRMAGGIAHDFNNLLTAILCQAGLLLEDGRPGEASYRAAEQIHRCAVRAAALTDQLLTFSRRRFVQPAAVDVNAALRSVEPMLRRLVSAPARLDVSYAEHDTTIPLSAGQFEQLVVNLVVNACEALCGRSGRVSVALSRARLDEPQLDRTNQPRDYAVLCVTDSGAGMDADVQARIFEPFFTTKGLRHDGLGLAVVYGLVTQGGGRVVVTSAPGMGTTIRILMPATHEAHKSVPSPQLTRANRAAQRRILVAEDDEAVRQVVVELLEQQGFAVIAKRDGAEAADFLSDPAQTVDLLISDVRMPSLSGPQLVQHVRPQRPTLPVLFISGYPQDDGFNARACTENVRFLSKPFSPAKLLSVTRELLGASAWSAREVPAAAS